LGGGGGLGGGGDVVQHALRIVYHFITSALNVDIYKTYINMHDFVSLCCEFGFKANYEKVPRKLSELLRTKQNDYCEGNRWPVRTLFR